MTQYIFPALNIRTDTVDISSDLRGSNKYKRKFDYPVKIKTAVKFFHEFHLPHPRPLPISYVGKSENIRAVEALRRCKSQECRFHYHRGICIFKVSSTMVSSAPRWASMTKELGKFQNAGKNVFQYKEIT